MIRTRTAMHHTLAILFALLFAGAVTADEAKLLSVSDSWIRATPPGASNGAGFLTLHNDGDSALQLTGVSCQTSVASRCELHEHIHREGRMRMQQVAAIDIPPRGSFRFAPGGHHVMLLGLVRPLVPGDKVELVFTFADQGTFHTAIPVKPIAGE